MTMTLQELSDLINAPQANNPGIDMVQASPQTAVNQFMDTGAYQLKYGDNKSIDPYQRFFNDAGTKLTYGDNSSTNPMERFNNDAGTQLAIQQGMKPLLDSYASRGLAQSGALAQALSDYGYKNYNQFINDQTQRYNDYSNGQSGLFNNYQQQLAQLTGLGAQNTGNQNAVNMSQLGAQLLGGANISTGQNLAQGIFGTGNNISSLQANQGGFGGSAMLNTGAMQNQNYLNGLSMALQAMYANNASGASAAGGQGAMNGATGGLF